MKQHLMIVLCLLVLSGPAQACIWDRDTLAMERARFPEVNELIVGYFPRHSLAYYEWRKEQVLAIPLEQRTPGDYDDLGASYDKLGEHEKAIDTMLAKFERYPDQGVYETHANLGTFYIHNGEFEKGAQYIGSAIEINPDAHFGREVYQKLLVEYVLQQRAAGNTLPLHPGERAAFGYSGEGFGGFVMLSQGIEGSASRDEEADRAIKGVLGMMRFGNYDSPILLEVLGDLLSGKALEEDAPQRLAVRAYLKASYETEDPDAAKRYLAKAKSAIGTQEGESLSNIEMQLKKEIAEGDAYFAKIEADEKAWIVAGKDVDAEFSATYYQAPIMKASMTDRIAEQARTRPLHLIVVALLIGVGLASALAVVFRARRRLAVADEPA